MKTFFDGNPVLFIDQYGQPVWARSRKELMQKVPGSVASMYRDKKDGPPVRTGYVIGQRWLSAFRPIEIPA